jgi:hypothetical protein
MAFLNQPRQQRHGHDQSRTAPRNAVSDAVDEINAMEKLIK